jgi:hypothetical protein
MARRNQKKADESREGREGGEVRMTGIFVASNLN